MMQSGDPIQSQFERESQIEFFVKKLIKAKLEAKTLKEPKDLGELYKLEEMICELRHEFEKVKAE